VPPVSQPESRPSATNPTPRVSKLPRDAQPSPPEPSGPRPGAEPGYLAIDLSPTRLAASIVTTNGDVLVRDRVSTPSRNVWPVVRQLVGRVLAANQSVLPTHCGVTCPGPIDRVTGAIRPIGMEVWRDFPLGDEMAALTGLPVAIDTPARALALAEQWLGESAGIAPSQQFAVLVLGDDVDGAVVAGGRLLGGQTGNLGQFGHLLVEPEGTPCACGAVGCLTTYAGVRGIESSTGRDLRRTPPAIVERTGIMTARACATLAAMLDVTDIVIGGVVPSVLGAPFFEALANELEQRSRLPHLQGLRVRGLATTRIGPLTSAAALAHRESSRERA
jgi:glucokinase